MQELEEEMGFLRERLSLLEKSVKDHLEASDEFFPDIEVPNQPKSFGRPTKISDENLKDRLRATLARVKIFWPQIEAAIAEATDAQTLAYLLVRNCSPTEGDFELQRLLKCRDAFWGFVTSDRYSGRAEQLACAMAGVPELKPRSSLDRCSKMLPIVDEWTAFVEHHTRTGGDLD
jgi:hypothetical protein